jgi:hypothetical protein
LGGTQQEPPYAARRREGPGRYTTMTLDIGEFIRRFLIHVLPKGFHRNRRIRLNTLGIFNFFFIQPPD